MEFVEIDGSFGEGGGQVVRTAISLSCILNKAIIIKNIRQNRKNPGLKPQHFTAIKILKKICNTNLDQIKIGDTSIKFIPSNVQSLDLKEDVGTAGSISLIIQVLIPVVAICKKKLKLTIIGGTNVLWSPTIDYTQTVLREVYRQEPDTWDIDRIRELEAEAFGYEWSEILKKIDGYRPGRRRHEKGKINRVRAYGMIRDGFDLRGMAKEFELTHQAIHSFIRINDLEELYSENSDMRKKSPSGTANPVIE